MDEIFMKRTLELAAKGAGNVNPNPLVGAVIVRNGEIIGEGYHHKYGENHAEVNAILSVEDKSLLKASTIYVNLEPCAHYGKTPPCAEAIVKYGFKRVVIGALDVNKRVAGKGVKILEDNGIKVKIGVLEKECLALNEIFYKFIAKNEPFVISKWASTLDGKISTHTGDSKWISSEESRQYVHNLRNRVAGILVGVDTVIKDDPLLTCRIENGVNPVRFILDTNGRTPIDAKILEINNGKNTFIVVDEKIDEVKIEKFINKGVGIIKCSTKEGKICLKSLMKIIGEMKIDSILIEGGSKVHASALKAGIVDKVIAFIAPKIIGAEGKYSIGDLNLDLMKDAITLKNPTYKTLGGDLVIEAYLR